MNKLDAIPKSLGACRKVGEWTVMLCEYLVSVHSCAFKGRNMLALKAGRRIPYFIQKRTLISV